MPTGTYVLRDNDIRNTCNSKAVNCVTISYTSPIQFPCFLAKKVVSYIWTCCAISIRWSIACLTTYIAFYNIYIYIY